MAASEAATALAVDNEPRVPRVADGHWAILIMSDGEQRMMQIRAGSKVFVGKGKVPLDPIIGTPFGANFRVEAGALVRDHRTLEEISGALGDAFAGVATAQPGASNAGFFDDGAKSTAQQLGEKEIRELKEKGVTGEDLVKAIAAGSKTFASKTAFVGLAAVVGFASSSSETSIASKRE